MVMRAVLGAGLAVWLAASGLMAQTLPIFLEESHAGTFYRLVETLPQGEAHTLVLIDAHSDANGIANSDAIRAEIRKGPTVARRAEMLGAWRRQGRIQCFDWLEPLMPVPITKVIWVPAVHLEEAERVKMEADAREYLDGHEEALPREAGALARRYEVRSLDQFEQEVQAGVHGGRFVASVDLDFFAKTADAELPEAVDRVMNDLLGLRELKALTFAISSPYLRDAAQAERLTLLALDAAWRVPNATVSFEPFAPTGPDKSLMARLLERRGRQVPKLELSRAGPALRSLLLDRWDAGKVQFNREEANHLMAEWAQDPFLPRLDVPGRARRPDGSWGFAADEEAAVTIMPEPTGARVRWFALHAATDAYRVGEVDFGFSTHAPKWIWWKRLLLGESLAQGRLSLAALKPVLDPARGCGTVHLYAEVERDGEVWRTPVETLCMRAAGAAGVRAAWSEQFSLPYLFDSRLLVKDYATGPDTHWGADCAAFITAGLRAEGWLLPWGSPKDLRLFLQPVARNALPEGADILIDFTNHVAALWEDKSPLGELNDTDLCVHQLEGQAEVISFAALSKGRAPAQAMMLKPPSSPIRLVFTGDIMLGRSVGDLIRAGEDPLQTLRPFLSAADLAVGNLECVISPGHSADQRRQPKIATGNKGLRLVAPPEAVTVLERSGFDALSVCNNHALDLGALGLDATKGLLTRAGMKPVDSKETSFTVKGVRISLLAWDDSHEPSVAGFINTILKARKSADYLVVLPHWGTEHQRIPTARQRELAAAFVGAGADLIVGSGPHIVQALEHYPYGSIAFSLGNTVFDGPGPDMNWSHGALLEVTLDGSTKRPVRMRQIPLKIADNGHARMTEER